MRAVSLARPDDAAGWRSAARALAQAGVPASDVGWTVAGEGGDLFAEEALPAPTANSRLTVPKPFLGLVDAVICHSDPERFALLYAMLLKLQDNRRALEDRADPLLKRLEVMRKAVGRDIHKMRAFVRFREVEGHDGSERFAAWFEPDHHIVRANAPFFQRRFAAMTWSILTPELCAHWDGAGLSFSEGAVKADAPGGDPVEETWKTYYASIFNPARVKVKAMTAEMPRKYWKNMPETALVPGLIAGARERELAMVERSRQALPAEPRPREAADMAMTKIGSWEQLAEEAQRRHGEEQGNAGTQLVFGEGRRDADLMFVGEQPGDQEDRAGRPFVGPAGQLFDQALGRAGIDRAETYVTNAVKRFKFEQRGKRRIHSKPGAQEIEAYRWWIEAERGLVAPDLTVALGATAARALLGKTVTISKTRGTALELPGGGRGLVTVHPSYLLRIPDKGKADEEMHRFVEDLETARKLAA
ncbi:uracil-DNA glycosylase [Pacificimonas flava]|uniref:Type-4 uracil-DNA glycosylase n=2 Tax=Pacificimonas TaxID=1960290 RepID=A0A219B6R0_9SPHN|nr:MULTISPECIES: UdgX family uracil-DNA binding protein [Pacificimonas]MBZ6379315.1 UdgX family uracil-DNA binding protein [Pacificimonas aurantium]OWV33479.1 uracil-DNA glycosylase [Pacificimonas flava]